MNGRQIKNAMNMTASWCRKTKECLNLETVEDVMKQITQVLHCRIGSLFKGSCKGFHV
ncbi:hypothetical protein F4781DRAFT_382762 [Annulohypoxylon bovei var. microspora]|nr:hypothetical protein F4781DRAFT_382762 [Annulohypoxylon bovei var. microspora]